MPTGRHKKLWRTMKEKNPCWSVVPVRVNERTRSGVNASWQKPKPAGQVSDGDGYHFTGAGP